MGTWGLDGPHGSALLWVRDLFGPSWSSVTWVALEGVGLGLLNPQLPELSGFFL